MVLKIFITRFAGIFLQNKLNEKFIEQNEKYNANPAFKAIHIRKRQLRKFAIGFSIVYNKAWASHEGNKQLNKDVAYKMFKAMKPVMDEDLIWFVYHNNEPIAFWVNLPELNQIFKYLNGKFGVFEKLKYLWLKKRVFAINLPELFLE